MRGIFSAVAFGLLVGLGLGCGKPPAPTGRATDPAPPAARGNPGPAPKGDGVAPKAEPAPAPSEEEVLKGLAGPWHVTSIQNPPPFWNLAGVKEVAARVRGNVVELSEAIGFFGTAEIRLDPAKSPAQFDLVALDNAGKVRTNKSFVGGKAEDRPVPPVKGIFTRTGDTLTIAITDRDDHRPAEFKPSVMPNTGRLVGPGERAPTYVVVVELARGEPAKPTGPDESTPRGVAKWFLAAVRGRDPDAAVRVAAAPFLIELGDPKNRRLVEKQADLKAELQGVMGGWPKLDEFPTAVVEAGEGRGHGLPPADLDRLKQINDPQDRVRDFGGFYVIPAVAAGPARGGRADMKLLLKDVGGKLRVVGLVTGPGATPY